jgi:alkylation response protein AidB-like acyl-CoA dehydrogenase
MAIDHEAIAREVRERFGPFFRERINPSAVERDQSYQTFPVEVLREMAGLGLIGFTAAKEIGGGGRTWEEWGHALEEIGYLADDSGLPMLLSYRETAINLVYQSAQRDRPHLIERYARPAVRGDAFIGWLFTEDTDILRLNTRVEKRGDRYLLNGWKIASTGGRTCTSWLVYAALPDASDTMVLMIHADDPGVEVKPLRSLGLRSIGLTEVSLSNVELDESRVVAATDGLSHAQLFINERRVTGAAWLLGRMRALIELVIDDAAPKRRLDREVLDLDTFKGLVGKMQIELERARATAYRVFERTEAGRAHDGHLHDPMVAVGKYTSTEAALAVADLAQRLAGGHGYFEKHGIERYLRDVYGLVPILGGQTAIEVQLGAHVIWQRQRAARAKGRKPA